ncbi:MAG: nascent polypeptide-associated complex protein [Euryarchaeota archaeon]|nr:nascent polypeptide-associated complex protein [Euryarchaeota archaeon]
MIPGGRGMNPRKINQMMKSMGISVEEIDGVESVVITTPEKEYVFTDAEVSIMKTPQGKTYQVVGEPEVRSRAPGGKSAATTPKGPKFTDDDVALVMAQTGAPREKAVAALEECDGEIARAIVSLGGS